MTSKLPASSDVVVIGAGNAAFCAALAAAESKVSVLVLERAPEAESGGNSRFTAGAFRCVYDGVDDLRRLMPDLTDEEIKNTDFGTYTEEQFFDDMGRVTEYRTDPELCETLVTRSRATMLWMRAKGIRFAPIFGRQAFKVDGKFKFWGGLTVESVGGGPGLVEGLTAAARKNGVTVAYEARALSLISDDDGIKGVRVRYKGKTVEVACKCVVLAAGGFQANAEMAHALPGPRLGARQGARHPLQHRRRHPHGARRRRPADRQLVGLARGWLGSQRAGVRRPRGRRQLPEAQLSVLDHAERQRRALRRRGRRLPQLHLRQVRPHHPLANRCSSPGRCSTARCCTCCATNTASSASPRCRADTLEELVQKLDDVNPEKALATIKAYNAAVKKDVPFNPNVKDGRGTIGLAIPKSNWSNILDTPPYEAYAVTCGITFTFGGLKIDSSAHVMDTDGQVIPGLFAAGELVGGLFYFNYPGGTGLMNGAVFGRIAGTTAGQRAAQLP